ncbi:hypothetical protein [Lichenifustis flavocetrariae]|uniref:Uncharacterized protein n=1 Tax=Lichenifustis flavocetrariae TaxID=2949735 RepID=A0AA41YSY0_9HYPH|nr:hypothetical protein [Lichenifustis flavocetrariae]MCW6508009.1 hypothetical protein [Lichenifustis flavocetrariae]
MSIATSGSTVYALSQNAGLDVLLGYDLSKQDPSSLALQPNVFDFLNPLTVPPSSIVSIAASGSMIYALSQNSAFDVLLGYDLSKQDPSSLALQPNVFDFLNPLTVPPSSLVSIAASGSTVYALSQNAAFDVLLGYDLSKQDPSSLALQPNVFDFLNIYQLPTDSIVSIAASGSTVYALSQNAAFNALLGYDLSNQDPSSLALQPDLQKFLNIDGLPTSSIVGIALEGSTVSAVPLPGGLPLAALGLLTLFATSKFRLFPLTGQRQNV